MPAPAAPEVTPAQVRALRVRAQQLGRSTGTLGGTAVLDVGVQETGPDGGRWALALRGVDVAALPEGALATAWTLRGAPHRYRRDDLPAVAAATAPFSEADAAKRIFDAVRPLRAAGIGALEGLDAVAAAMRGLVTEPMVKGDVSGALAATMGAPHLRDCRACGATHPYEMPFRLAALRAGLELRAGTSPPVLERVPGFAAAREVPARLDVVRAHLALLGPAAPTHVAASLDAPLADVRARWPDDAVEVSVGGSRRWLLAGDVDALGAGPVRGALPLGPYDLFLQARDREVLTTDAARVKEVAPVIGRPGGVLVDGALTGTWRPRQTGSRLTVTVRWWEEPSAAARAAVHEQAERLAAFRGVRLAQVLSA